MEIRIMRNFVKRPLLTVGGVLVLVSFLVATACSSVMQAAGDGVTSAVSGAVEREVERSVTGMLEGYTSAMLYQVAYTQAFMVGGYGVDIDDFNEGEGSTWYVEAGDDEEMHNYTVERALLSVDEDGASWWYFRYQPDGDEPIEYEMRMTATHDPMEMYVKDPETGEVEYRQFAQHERSDADMEESEEDIEDEGFRTARYDLEAWEDHIDGEETLTIGDYTFNATILLYEGSEEEGDEGVSVRWWVSEDVPGELLKYTMVDENEGGRANGEMIDLRTDYTAKFAEI